MANSFMNLLGDALLVGSGNGAIVQREKELQAAAQAEMQKQALQERAAKATADALLKISDAQDPQEVSQAIGNAVSLGADPKIFDEYQKSTLKPIDVQNPFGEPQITSEFRAVRNGLTPLPKTPQTVVNVNDTKENAFQKKMGEIGAQRVSDKLTELETNYTASNSVMQALPTIEQALADPNVRTDPLAQARIFATNLGKAVGLNVDNTETANLENLQSKFGEIWLKYRQALKGQGAITDKESSKVEEIIGNVGKSREANEAFVDFMKQLSTVNNDRYQIGQSVLADPTIDPNQLETTLNKKLTDYDKTVKIKPYNFPVEPPVGSDGKINGKKLESGRVYIIGGKRYQWDGNQFMEK